MLTEQTQHSNPRCEEAIVLVSLLSSQQQSRLRVKTRRHTGQSFTL